MKTLAEGVYNFNMELMGKITISKIKFDSYLK